MYETYKRLGWSDEDIWNFISETTACDDGIGEED